MKLFIDARWVRTDYHDGISRYTAGLAQGCLENHQEVTVLIHGMRQLDLLPAGVAYEKVNYPISWRELFLPRRLNELGADVVFSPLQVMGFWKRDYKLILTLQDIIYYRHPTPPTNLPWHVRAVWRAFHSAYWPQRALLNRADHVVTVSATSKKFIEEYSLTDRNITVVYNAPNAQLMPKPKVARASKDIVYMGSFMPYKNVETLVRGMNMLPRDYTLHLLSKIHDERKQELQALANEKVRIVFHNGISDEDYIKLLASAHCLATATKEEGFGLPLTEAQRIGTPVVCSDLPVLREVAGDGALYFSANDAKQFAHAVRQLEKPETWLRISSAGRQQSSQFTWAHSADVLYRLAQSL